MASGSPPPPGTSRLFPGAESARLADPQSSPDVTARLLEDGDTLDLAWLVDRCDEAALAGWIAERGGRQLSRRSRAFWSLLLDRSPSERPEAADEVWPL